MSNVHLSFPICVTFRVIAYREFHFRSPLIGQQNDKVSKLRSSWHLSDAFRISQWKSVFLAVNANVPGGSGGGGGLREERNERGSCLHLIAHVTTYNFGFSAVRKPSAEEW